VRGRTFRCAALALRQDREQHAVEVRMNFRILKPHDGIAPRVQVSRPLLVAAVAAVVRRAVGLDDQPALRTVEVRDVVADGDLPAELEAVQLSVAQALPEHLLRRGLAGA